jgi:hypothetical protein
LPEGQEEPVFDIIAPHFDDLVALKTISLCGRHLPLFREEYLSRVFGRIGNMELTELSYDFYRPWFGLTFTLGDSGPFTFASRMRALGAGMPGTKYWLPKVVQLPAISLLDLKIISDRHLPTVEAVLKLGGQSIRTIKLGFCIPSSTGTSRML